MINQEHDSDKKYPYTLILTHDVDHLSLRSYPVFSKTTLSFFKRCLWNNLLRTFKKDIRFKNYLDSIKWCILYPFIKLGIVDDPWEKAIFDIVSLEKKYSAYSTLFFIPFPNMPGYIKQGLQAPKGRAAMYDIREYKKLLHKLELEGWEVGVHGINAHISIENAREELNVIKKLLPQKEKIGIRMHWLYQTDDLWKNLREAGFHYDATLGSNDKVGFSNGEYKLIKRDNLWVIPLNIQDGTLLGHWRKGLSIKNAWIEIEKVLNIAKEKNAVVTILWHTNVFGVYNYWGDVYQKILQKAQSDGARIMKCIDICNETDKSVKGVSR